MRKVFPIQIAAACLLFSLTGPARAFDAPPENPFTVAEICAKLHAGTTSPDILGALPSRHVLDKPTPAEEQTLRAAGATPHLIETLDAGTYTLSPFDAADARKRLATAPAGGQPGAAGNPGHMASLLRGKLVTFENGSTRSPTTWPNWSATARGCNKAFPPGIPA